MLNRRQLRVKVLQNLYVYFQNSSVSIETIEKTLKRSINNIYDLYINLLSAIIEVGDTALLRIEEGYQKHLPTEEDKNPNKRFIENRVLKQLKASVELEKEISRLKINWSDNKEFFRSIYRQFRETEAYNEYMLMTDSSYKIDRDIIFYLLCDIILESSNFDSFIENNALCWSADTEIVATMISKTLKSWNEKTDNNTPVFKISDNINECGDDLIEDFAVQLLLKTIVNNKDFNTIISKCSVNWEFDRIALIDLIILKMAICEFLFFETIPVKVTLNEYIEIAKVYSTKKSPQFINGILDKLANEFQETGKIKKTGRGLIES